MALGRVRLDAGHGLVGGQLIGHLVVTVIDAAGDQRAVRIAFEKLDHNFLVDARNDNCAPFAGGPGLRNAHAAGLVRFAVPEETHEDAAMLVDVDFLTRRAALVGDDLGGLRAVDQRFWRHDRGAVLDAGGQKLIAAEIALGLRPRPGRAVILPDINMRRAHDEIFLVLVLGLQLGKRRQSAGKQAKRVTIGVAPLVARQLGLQQGLGIGLPFALVLVLAGIIVDFHIRLGVGRRAFGRPDHVCGGRQVIIVLQLELSAFEAPLRRPAVDMLFIAPLGRGGNEIHGGEAGYRLVR